MPSDQLEGPPLCGRLHEIPFLGAHLGSRAAPMYAELVEAYGVDNVLVFKRFPAGVEDVTDRLAEDVATVELPWVRTLSRHSRRVLEEIDDPPTILSQAERGVVMKSFLDEFDWSHEYLERASTQESFDPDASRFSVEATWQGDAIDTDDPVLRELAAMNESFQALLDDHGYLDRAAVLARAIQALRDEDIARRIRSEFDALLVLEFEEFTRIDRTYLSHLARDTDLTCVAERHSSIQRTWNEPRPIEEHTPDLEPNRAPDASPESRPEAVARFLATGDAIDSSDEGDVVVIDEDTFEEQVTTVGEEIERLRRSRGWSYDDFAVVLRDANAPIDETVRLLRASGIPTASATVSGLPHDPAARELYTLGVYLRSTPGDDSERARRRLEARVPGLADDTLVALEGESGVADAVWSWVLETDLKRRIAEAASPLDAKTQFQHVSDVIDLARFLDRTDAVDATWEWFCIGLEREFQRASSDKIATELDTEEGGVLVDAARVFKNTTRKAVFLLNVVENEYPTEPRFNALFPTPHLKALPDYPAFTTPTVDDVRETFPTASGDILEPLDAYYAELSRRLLAVGARAATDRVYFGTYREKTGKTGTIRQPSRFLGAAEEHFGAFERLDHDEIHSHGRAVRFALSRVDEAVESIRLAGIADAEVDLDDVESDFGAVQAILEEAPDDLERAVHTRVDFADGRVRRD